MNKVILMGRLTRDPEVRYTQTNNTLVASFSLAVNRRFVRQGEERQADFINIVAFDRAGEFAEKYFRQGMRVLISGRIQTGSYTNKEGQRVYTTEVIVDDQEFADSKNANSGGGDNGGYGYQPTSRPAPSSAIGDGFMNIPDGVEDEGLPFN